MSTSLHADATPFLAPYPPRRVRRPVVLQLAEESYPLEELPAESWLSIAFRAFARLAAGRSVHDLLIIGSGNGLDALGAVEIFADLRSLSVTDLYPASLAATRANVLEHLVPGADIRLTFVAGDLLANVSPEARFSLVYENLPNIPAGADVELHGGQVPEERPGAVEAVDEPEDQRDDHQGGDDRSDGDDHSERQATTNALRRVASGCRRDDHLTEPVAPALDVVRFISKWIRILQEVSKPCHCSLPSAA